MAAGVIRNFLIQGAPTPSYFPLMFQCSAEEESEEKLQEREEEEGDREEEEEEEDEEEEEEEEEEDEECEAQEEEEECLEEVFLPPPPCALDVTKQLLNFADLISRDVQRYFGPRSRDQDACDIYSDSVSVTTSGRLRYYDDLLRIARAGSPEEPESGPVTGAGVPRGDASLGPLAELFNHVGPSQGRSRPMIKRHLPLSFWAEPTPCCPLAALADAPDATNGNTPSQGAGAHVHTDTHSPFNTLHNTHTPESNQLDFSDLLAYWDPNPELTHTLTENTHMEH